MLHNRWLNICLDYKSESKTQDPYPKCSPLLFWCFIIAGVIHVTMQVPVWITRGCMRHSYSAMVQVRLRATVTLLWNRYCRVRLTARSGLPATVELHGWETVPIQVEFLVMVYGSGVLALSRVAGSVPGTQLKSQILGCPIIVHRN
jgi:hypothetical protein